MPYHIEREGNQYKVVVDATGRVVGTHPSKAQAQAQLGALYSNVPEVKKCMTCGCDDLGNDHHYISDTEKCNFCVRKGQGPCWDGYEYAGTKEQNGKTVPNCVPKNVKKSIITGGSSWSVEFNTPDCQHGWAIIKDGTGQSIGCYLTKEEAEKALEGLDNKGIDILGDEVRTTKTPEEIKEDSMKKSFQSESFWSGIFVPEGEALSGVNYGTLYQDDRYYFPSESTYDKDGKPSIGYGNSSGSSGRSF